MYAVIENGGKQYRVELGAELELDQLSADPGETIDIGRVLLVADGDEALIGRPTVEGARVTGEVVRATRGEKLIVFKYRPKARRRVKHGHRQDLTLVRIADIEFAGRSAAREAQAEMAEQELARAEAAQAAKAKAKADQALADKLAREQAATAEEAKPTKAATSKTVAKPTTAKTKPAGKTAAKAKPAVKTATKAKPAAKATAAKASTAKSTAAKPTTKRSTSTKSGPVTPKQKEE